ncbi:MAG: HD domain-containing protein [Sedimentisphaerales bacterium]|nr:HD domain-containing protein [Sedimentisphaerales bacterium]
MAEIIDKRKGPLSLLDFTCFAKSLQSLDCNFALCDIDGQVLYMYENDNFETDIHFVGQIVKPVIQSGKFSDDSCGFELLQKRYIATRLDLSEMMSEPQSWPGLMVIDLGTKQRQEDTVTALGRMLKVLAENFQTQIQTNNQIEMVSSELSKMYEELVLLHKLSSNMKVTESDFNYLQMACDSLTDIVSVEGIAVLVERFIDKQKQMIIAAGAGLINIDQHMGEIIADRLEQQIRQGKEALLDSEVDSPFKYAWPDTVKNIIAVPLFAKEKSRSSNDTSHRMIGFMVAVNRIGKADFDSIDAKLFNSVANGCAVFIENGNLFNDLKELFIGSLKALTSSIDAKDPYTRGHSERVAFISKWIAEQLAKNDILDRQQVHQVYLAGLLHDIGKMGVDESVLRKKGKLTEQEFSRIKEHPPIGAGILGGIKQMHDIVPGVLSHHERFDGKGYPCGLAGEQIPLIARIISLADSFDAMTSKRTYREALTVEQAIAEIQEGLGTQFDEKIGSLFLQSDIYHLWDMIQDGLKDMYTAYEISNYGTVAVGTLLG